jgi:outer membrane lipoprotein SlyB
MVPAGQMPSRREKKSKDKAKTRKKRGMGIMKRRSVKNSGPCGAVAAVPVAVVPVAAVPVAAVLVAILVALATLAPACATTTGYSTTWTDPSAPDPSWSRTGRVESVREVVQRQQGNPAGGALAGALIGGFLFGGRGPRALVGAVGGAAVGAAASQGSSERISYELHVRFDDGTYGMFVYGGYPPFRPGEPVVLTPQGLAHM